jgi:hypothetical protein
VTPDQVDAERAALALAILHSNGGRCVACDGPAEHVDHFKPRHAGGPDIPENLVPLCEPCNTVKSCMWPGHGYHPFPGRCDPIAAAEILAAEMDYLTGIYGESRLIAAIGPDIADLASQLLDRRGQDRDRRRDAYLHLAEALAAELGDRAFWHWYRGGRVNGRMIWPPSPSPYERAWHPKRPAGYERACQAKRRAARSYRPPGHAPNERIIP